MGRGSGEERYYRVEVAWDGEWVEYALYRAVTAEKALYEAVRNMKKARRDSAQKFRLVEVRETLLKGM